MCWPIGVYVRFLRAFASTCTNGPVLLGVVLLGRWRGLSGSIVDVRGFGGVSGRCGTATAVRVVGRGSVGEIVREVFLSSFGSESHGESPQIGRAHV